MFGTKIRQLLPHLIPYTNDSWKETGRENELYNPPKFLYINAYTEDLMILHEIQNFPY